MLLGPALAGTFCLKMQDLELWTWSSESKWRKISFLSEVFFLPNEKNGREAGQPTAKQASLFWSDSNLYYWREKKKKKEKFYFRMICWTTYRRWMWKLSMKCWLAIKLPLRVPLNDLTKNKDFLQAVFMESFWDFLESWLIALIWFLHCYKDQSFGAWF